MEVKLTEVEKKTVGEIKELKFIPGKRGKRVNLFNKLAENLFQRGVARSKISILITQFTGYRYNYIIRFLDAKYKGRKGSHHTKETKKKISKALRGKPGLKGESCPRYGKPGTFRGRKHTEETKIKVSKTMRGKNTGPDSPTWRGGVSFLPYGPEFNTALKRSIHERDGKCFYPGCGTMENLVVHHINYNKMNNVPRNLIVLCRTHNSKVNKNRDYWEQYFINVLEEVAKW